MDHAFVFMPVRSELVDGWLSLFYPYSSSAFYSYSYQEGYYKSTFCILNSGVLSHK